MTGCQQDLIFVFFVVRRTLLIPALLQKMSSNLTSFVPVLDGTNYQQWAAQMQLYLMSQGQWPYVTKNPPTGSVIALQSSSSMTKKPADDNEADPSALLTDADAIAKLDENNTKAVGNIRLCLHHWESL